MKRKLCLITLMLVALQLLAPNDHLSLSRSKDVVNKYEEEAHKYIRIKNLLTAMKIVESGNNYYRKGASGEKGAFQFMKSTWEKYSILYYKKVLIMTPENQEDIALKIVKELVSKGYNDLEIASIWNCGSPVWKGKVGKNKYGVKYNVPRHVEKVKQQLIKIKNERF